MKPYFTDEQATLYLGDALTALQSLPDASINCCVTSPHYFGLRSYLPDGGSGTTGLAAAELGRRYIGIDLNRDYLELSLRTRLSQPSLTAEVGS